MVSIIVAVDLTQFTCEEQKQPLVMSVGLLSMTRIVLENRGGAIRGVLPGI